MKKFLRLTLILVSISLVVGGAFVFYSWQWLNEVKAVPDEIRMLEIRRGDSLYVLARRLNNEGFIAWPMVWIQFAKMQGLTEIKVGEYALDDSESPYSLLKKINSGDVVHYQVTLVEGMNFKEILSRLQAHKKIKSTFDYSNYESALATAGIDVDHPEGWFYPDTYSFTARASEISVLKRAHEKMKVVLSQQWQERDDNLPYDNVYEALIMASIVEKETGLASERGEIAGVFVRRLRKKMRLQTDPTVIYGMGEAYDGNITRKDLRTPTPYNTYLIKGLPPTPIAMPGVDAIYAALHPEPGETLYFVARGDGSHYFSTTLEEHNDAVNQYQKRRRKNYRSSPQSAQP